MSNALNALIGKRLKLARLSLEVSGADVAIQMGISSNHYRRIEKGYGPISLPALVKAGAALCVSTDYLLGVAADALKESEQDTRSWIVNAMAKLSADRRVLATRYARIEGDNERLLSLTVDLIGTATDFLCAFERVRELNPEEFDDLKAGAALVNAANDFRQAKYQAQLEF